MAERGLHASIWASGANGNARYEPRPGDWNCPVCGFSNYQRRTECFRCSQKGLRASASAHTSRSITPNLPESAVPQDGQGWNQAGITHAGAPSQQKEDSTWNASQPRDRELGLAMSRWAPRNYDGRAKAFDKSEVWTRTIPAAEPSEARTTAANPPDLGLPYEVQHFILAMIQRILEEGCYDFASRWIPDTLYGKGWTCSEAVELSTWKKTLPDIIPYKAISPVPNYSLERALSDAVSIRNAAVHRHLCDNREIGRMSSHAEDLMFMFSDVTRQSKFHRLQEELKQWDSAVTVDQQEKRNKLESALREISERPVDDMDWTPNAVSLQEIVSRPESPQAQETEEYIDQMEVD